MSQESKIEVINRDGWRKNYPLSKGIVYIGSAPNNDIVLESLHGGGVAPLHAQLIANHSGYKLINLATVDIELGETMLPPRSVVDISDGQHFKLGEFTLVYRGDGAHIDRHPGATEGTGSRSIGISLSMPTTQLIPHQSLEGVVTVRNLGGRTGIRFEVDLEGLEEECYDVAPGPLLSSGAEKDVLFRIHHRGTKPLAGEWNIVLRVTAPKGYPGEQAVISQKIQVLPLYRHRLRLLSANEKMTSETEESFLTPKARAAPLENQEQPFASRGGGTQGDDWWDGSAEAEQTPPDVVRLQARPSAAKQVEPASLETQTASPPSEDAAEDAGEWGWETADATSLTSEPEPVIVGEETGDWGWETEGETEQPPPAQPVSQPLETPAVVVVETEIASTESDVGAQAQAEPSFVESSPVEEPAAQQTQAVLSSSEIITAQTVETVDQSPEGIQASPVEESGAVQSPQPETTKEDKTSKPQEAALPVLTEQEAQIGVSAETETTPADESVAVASPETELEPEPASSEQGWWRRVTDWLPFAPTKEAEGSTIEPDIQGHSSPERVLEDTADEAIYPGEETLETEQPHPSPDNTAGVIVTEAAEAQVMPSQAEEVVPPSQVEVETPAEVETASAQEQPAIELPPLEPEIAPPMVVEEIVEEVEDAERPQTGETLEAKAAEVAEATPQEATAAREEKVDDWSAVEFEGETAVEEAEVLRVEADTPPAEETSQISEIEETSSEAEDWWNFEEEGSAEVEKEKVIKLKADTPPSSSKKKEEVSEVEDWWSADS